MAELLVKNGGFKEAYAVDGGIRGKNGWLVFFSSVCIKFYVTLLLAQGPSQIYRKLKQGVPFLHATYIFSPYSNTVFKMLGLFICYKNFYCNESTMLSVTLHTSGPAL